MLKELFKKKQSSYEVFEKELLKKNADIAQLNNLIESSEVDINYVNENNETFLHICLKAKRVQNALWLLSKNIDTTIADSSGLTPFDIAINNQSHRVVKALLDTTKVDLNKKNQYGRTFLHDSVILGDHEMAKILIENGANINIRDNKNRNVLYDALSYNHEGFIDYLLSLDGFELNHYDMDNNTLLHHKSVKDNEKLAIKLIDKGADPTLEDKDGMSFLNYCVLKGIDALEVIEFSKQKGYDINATFKNDETILMTLVDEELRLTKSEDEDRRKSIRYMLKQLVSNGLDINTLNQNNETVLFKAVRAKDEKLVKFLLSAKIKVNIVNNKGETALALAVYQGIESINTITELLKYKADPTVKNQDDKTLFEEINNIILIDGYAKELKGEENLDQKHLTAQYTRILQEILKYYKEDLSFLDSTGNPLFYEPLMYNNIPLFYMYMKKGLNLFKLNKNGNNLFFEYVVKVFENDDDTIDLQSALNILIGAKVNHNFQDETGWTALSKIIATTPCNLKLFKTLIKVVRFDYTILDKLGRSAVHSAVWKGNDNVVKIINMIDSKIKDMPDNYGLLPIVYAALLGNQKLVLTFISLKAKVTTDLTISQGAIKKFTPMLANLDKLTINLKDQLQRRQMDEVIEKIKQEFKENTISE